MGQINATEKAKKGYQDRLLSLYDSFYRKALDGDAQAFKAFVDCASILFSNTEESELSKILNDAVLKDD